MPSATVGLFDDVITFSVIVKHFYSLGREGLGCHRVMIPPGTGSGLAPEAVHGFTGIGAALLLEVSRPCTSEDNYFEDVRLAAKPKRQQDRPTFALPALMRKLILSFEGQADGIEPDEIIRQVVEVTPEVVEA